MTTLPWRQVGDVWTCEEVRGGVILSHRWSTGGPYGNIRTVVTWPDPDPEGRIASVLECSVVIGDRDPLEVADGMARGWTV